MPKNRHGERFWCDVCNEWFQSYSKGIKREAAYTAHKCRSKKHKEKYAQLQRMQKKADSNGRVMKITSDDIERFEMVELSEDEYLEEAQDADLFENEFDNDGLENAGDFYGDFDSDESVNEEADEEDMIDGVDDDEPEEVAKKARKDEVDEVEEDETIFSPSQIRKSDCRWNEVLMVQQFILKNFFNSVRVRFNKVNEEVVDVDLALSFLEHMEKFNLSREEADEFLRFQNEIILSVTKKPFNVPACSKTFKRVFFEKIDKYVPIQKANIPMAPDFFSKVEVKRQKNLIPTRGCFIKLEHAIAELLLRINPNSLVKEMAPEYIENHLQQGGNRERIYTGWSSGRYAIELQRQIKEEYEAMGSKMPLILYVSIFIDSAVMNSTHSRSATPVLLSVLNSKEKDMTLVGLVPGNMAYSKEELRSMLNEIGLNKTAKKYVLQLVPRQLLWEYCEMFLDFMERQKKAKGFDVQVGVGNEAQFHKVHVVFTNFIGDHPQMHALGGVSKTGCMMCMKDDFSNFCVHVGDDVVLLTDEDAYHDRHAGTQYNRCFHLYHAMRDFINRVDGYNTPLKRQERIDAIKKAKGYHAQSGVVKPLLIFKSICAGGKVQF